MSNDQSYASTPTHISVTYADGSHSFWLAPGALIAELALHVGGLDALHDRTPLEIAISLGRPRTSATADSLRQQISTARFN